MNEPFTIRPVTVLDAAIVARHRAEMFKDMGTLPEPLHAQLVEGTKERLLVAISSGEYVGWLATRAGRPNEVFAGAGMQLRRVLPHPSRTPGESKVMEGRQGLVINVFTEAPWRRRGLAMLLMDHLLAWCEANGVETIVLHASDEGRRLYERLGFVATNEMRYTWPKRRSAGPPSSGTDPST